MASPASVWRMVAPIDDLRVDEASVVAIRDALQHPVVGRRPAPARTRAAPARRGDERDRRGEAEHDLRQAGVGDRDRIRQVPQHRDAAEDALGDDGAERDESEPRTHGRGSTRQSETASTRIRKPTVLAISRWLCS